MAQQIDRSVNTAVGQAVGPAVRDAAQAEVAAAVPGVVDKAVARAAGRLEHELAGMVEASPRGSSALRDDPVVAESPARAARAASAPPAADNFFSLFVSFPTLADQSSFVAKVAKAGFTDYVTSNTGGRFNIYLGRWESAAEARSKRSQISSIYSGSIEVRDKFGHAV